MPGQLVDRGDPVAAEGFRDRIRVTQERVQERPRRPWRFRVDALVRFILHIGSIDVLIIHDETFRRGQRRDRGSSLGGRTRYDVIVNAFAKVGKRGKRSVFVYGSNYDYALDTTGNVIGCVPSTVARCADHCDAGIDGALDRSLQRTVSRGTQTVYGQVDNIRVEFHCKLDGRIDGAHAADAVVVHGLDGNDPCFRADAGNDLRHTGAMTVPVRSVVAHDAVERGDMLTVGAGVDNSDHRSLVRFLLFLRILVFRTELFNRGLRLGKRVGFRVHLRRLKLRFLNGHNILILRDHDRDIHIRGLGIVGIIHIGQLRFILRSKLHEICSVHLRQDCVLCDDVLLVGGNQDAAGGKINLIQLGRVVSLLIILQLYLVRLGLRRLLHFGLLLGRLLGGRNVFRFLLRLLGFI